MNRAHRSHRPPGAPIAHLLSDSKVGQSLTVHQVQAPAGAPEWAGQLHDLGFVPGEQVKLMARGLGGDPLVVRVGLSTYALRRAEAACVHTAPAAPRAAAGPRDA